MPTRMRTEEVIVEGPGYRLPSTLVLPDSTTPVPGVVFFAGSGPTDRDWTSPLLPGTNGSGAQLALALGARGIGSIRFDKVGSGRNLPAPDDPDAMQMLDILSLRHYVDEALAAFEALGAQGRCGPIFLLGHSEGSIHASAASIARQSDGRFGGFISLSGPSRSLLDTAIEQVRALRANAGADRTAVDRALEDFRSAMLEPTAPEPDLSSIPEAAALWHAAHAPGLQRVARELILVDPLAELPTYRGRALVVSAANDVQVPVTDGDRILDALGSAPADKHRVTIPDANHVYKSEPRQPSTVPPAEILAGYADEGHPLAAGLVEAIEAFIRG